VRLCDLDLSLEGSWVEPRLERLLCELADRRVRFRPHFWISTDWFSPDGVPGLAVPFYVVHARLRALERRQIGDVEGGTHEWCMRLLRHEAAHALDTALGLHRRKDWRAIFGPWSRPYTAHYQPRPYSRSFVEHLDHGYAQSHPAEDWAETFAVWLRPGDQWRRRYAGWPALRKLEYVERLLAEVGRQAPRHRSRERTDALGGLRTTLREYYAEKRQRYGLDRAAAYEGELARLFAPRGEQARAPSAARFLSRSRRDLRRRVAQWTGEYQYTIDEVLAQLIERARELDLVLRHDEARTLLDASVMLAVQAMIHLQRGYHRQAR
jgi:hypothetical protein